MHIQLLGLSYKKAPVTVLERVSFTKEELEPALKALKDHSGEGVILSTCNRMEIYTVSRSKDYKNGALKAFLSSYRSLDIDSLAPYLYSYYDQEAARHLFRVASGLDSMILGEFQVLGQVRVAPTKTAGPPPWFSPSLDHSTTPSARDAGYETRPV